MPVWSHKAFCAKMAALTTESWIHSKLRDKIVPSDSSHPLPTIAVGLISCFCFLWLAAVKPGSPQKQQHHFWVEVRWVICGAYTANRVGGPCGEHCHCTVCCALKTLCSAAMSQWRRDPCSGSRWWDLPLQFIIPGQVIEKVQVAQKDSNGCTLQCQKCR